MGFFQQLFAPLVQAFQPFVPLFQPMLMPLWQLFKPVVVSTAQVAQQVANWLVTGSAPQSSVPPPAASGPTPEEIELLERMQRREKQRLREQARLEELTGRDIGNAGLGSRPSVITKSRYASGPRQPVSLAETKAEIEDPMLRKYKRRYQKMPETMEGLLKTTTLDKAGYILFADVVQDKDKSIRMNKPQQRGFALVTSVRRDQAFVQDIDQELEGQQLEACREALGRPVTAGECRRRVEFLLAVAEYNSGRIRALLDAMYYDGTISVLTADEIEEVQILIQNDPTNVIGDVMRAAREAGIDPVLLGMIVFQENRSVGAQDYLTTIVTNAVKNLVGQPLGFNESEPSFGEAQIQPMNAIRVLEAFPDEFRDEIAQITNPNPNGTYDSGALGHLLTTDDEFNVRVGAYHIVLIREDIVDFLNNFDGITVSDEPIPGEDIITMEQIDRLVIGAYNQGTNYLFEGLNRRFEAGGRVDVLDGIQETEIIPYVYDVFSRRRLLEAMLNSTYPYDFPPSFDEDN